MYDELSAFIGLIVIELQNFRQKELQYKYDEVDHEKLSDIKTIIERLHVVQEILDNKKDYVEICKCIKFWRDEYKLGQNIISATLKNSYPTGYCFVAKAVCKRMVKSELIDDVYNFLDALGYYIKYYYYDE